LSTNCVVTEADVLARNFPQFNIKFLIHGVENNNLTMSHSYGPIFAQPRTAPKAPPPTQGGTGEFPPELTFCERAGFIFV
jgi:hypothetical protein